MPFLFLPVMAAVLWALSLHRGLLALCSVLGFLGFGFHLIIETIVLSESVSNMLKITEMGVYTLFYGICLLVFLHRIFSERMVTLDTIQGGDSRLFFERIVMGIFLSYSVLI